MFTRKLVGTRTGKTNSINIKIVSTTYDNRYNKNLKLYKNAFIDVQIKNRYNNNEQYCLIVMNNIV
jgi:hypothetical protein